MENMKIKVNGMSCGHCVGSVERALRKVTGLEVEQVEIGSVRVRYDPSSASPAQIVAAVEDAGYGVEAGDG